MTQNSSSTTRWLLLFVVISLALFGIACPTQDLERPPDWRSGADKDREGATEIPLNAVHFDNADFKGGDRTDWKYFVIPQPGVVSLNVAFDNSKAFGEVVVTDEVGNVLSSFADEKRDLLDRITFKAESGKYFIKVWVNAQDSDYSLQVNYSAL